MNIIKTFINTILIDQSRVDNPLMCRQSLLIGLIVGLVDVLLWLIVDLSLLL